LLSKPRALVLYLRYTESALEGIVNTELNHLIIMNSITKKFMLSACVLASLSTLSFAAKKEKKVWNETLDKYFTQIEATEVAPDAEGFIRRWNLLEPISKPNRGNTVFVDSYVRDAFAKQYFDGQMTMMPEDGQKVKVVEEVEVVEKGTPTDMRRMMGPAKIEEV